MTKDSPHQFELTTTVSRLKDVSADWLKYYDAVYLGDPFCQLLIGNLLENKSDLEQAIRQVKALGKKAYLSTYVEPWTDKMPQIKEMVEFALKQGADAIEVLDTGVLYMVAKNFPDAQIHVSFLNIFNPQSADVLHPYRVRRILPSYELALEEIDQIKDQSMLEVEIQVHGRLPLGYSEICLLYPDKIRQGKVCAGSCYSEHILRYRDLSLRTTGRLMLSGKDLCMAEHLEMLWHKGYRNFRIEGRRENNSYRKEVGKVYRGKIGGMLAGTASLDDSKMMDMLSQFSPEGFCDGHYFGRPGREYIGHAVV